MEKLFQLKKHNTNVRTEIIAGLTTFFAMAYIIFVNPSYLSADGHGSHGRSWWPPVVSAAIGCFLTAFLANVPFAQAPGMGLNAFFTYTDLLRHGLHLAAGVWPSCSSRGILFLIIAVSPIRKQDHRLHPRLSEERPSAPASACSSAFIGLLNAGIVSFGAGVHGLLLPTTPRRARSRLPARLLALIGLLITGILMAWKVKGAMFIGIIVTTIIGIPMGVTNLPTRASFESISIAPTFVQARASPACCARRHPAPDHRHRHLRHRATALIPWAPSSAPPATPACWTRTATCPGGDRALIADAIATCVRRLLGTSTVTTFVESSTGICRRRPHRSELRRGGHPVPAELRRSRPIARYHPSAGYRSRPDHRGHVHDAATRRKHRLERL